MALPRRRAARRGRRWRVPRADGWCWSRHRSPRPGRRSRVTWRSASLAASLPSPCADRQRCYSAAVRARAGRGGGRPRGPAAGRRPLTAAPTAARRSSPVTIADPPGAEARAASRKPERRARARRGRRSRPAGRGAGGAARPPRGGAAGAGRRGAGAALRRRAVACMGGTVVRPSDANKCSDRNIACNARCGMPDLRSGVAAGAPGGNAVTMRGTMDCHVGNCGVAWGNATAAAERDV